MTIKTDKPSILIDCRGENVENPLWHPQHQHLYWTDIPAGEMYRYYPQTDTYTQIYDGEPVGGFTIQADGGLLLFKTKGTVEIWNEGKTTIVIPEIPAASQSRFNDAIADPEGRVYSGIMATETTDGKLYRIDTDGSYHVMAEGLLVPNGMGFCNNYRHFYLTDSDHRTIYRFDYDRETGNLSNQEPYIIIPENEGVPDGMTIDSEGYIWSARWDGSHVFRYSPEGEEVMRIELPVKRVSCIAFGGENHDRLFISTAKGNKATADIDDRRSESAAGNIFHLQVGVTGKPELLSRICLT